WTVTSRPTGSSSSPAPSTSPTASLYLDGSGDYGLQLCATDDELEVACCTTSVTATAPGAIHVELSWDQPHGDVDLHLLNVTRTQPDGWWTTDDCNWTNPGPEWGPLGADANPTLDVDDQDGFGPENITIDVNPASGTYALALHYYCDQSAGGSGAATATMRVYCDGALVGTYGGIALGQTDDWITVATLDYPTCRARSINRSSSGSATLPASYTSVRHCEMRCASTADCPALERCAAVVGSGGRRNICVLDR
ncbi:MAG: hypothetical protein OEY14_08425, partial [Myxococcales bacterium]|nr:hypothetical protein [Myxococcales bacterium]